MKTCLPLLLILLIAMTWASPAAQAAPANAPTVSFSDVAPSDFFYTPVTYLASLGVVSGYDDGSFRPYASTTRGQLSKIVVLSQNWNANTTGGPHFLDVAPDNAFYSFIETAYNHGIIDGYDASGGRDFRWGQPVTRGQLAKIIVRAAGWSLVTPTQPHFSDVAADDPFYGFVETAASKGLISGYSDNSFRPGVVATRGQISKIIYQSLTNVIWRPAVATTWQWQLSSTPVDQTVSAAMYDIDLFDNAASVVAQLHAAGSKVVCYISAGSYENWRPDAASFPAAAVGADYAGWPGEKWLDIRRIDLLGPIMRARLDLCKAKGFDAIEPDNIDGYTNATGFPLTADDQIAYNTWLANEAHARGLSIGLKNDSDQATELQPLFDWALTEDCFDQGWCAQVSTFVANGKPVFAAEYTDTGATTSSFCSQAATLRFNAILKHRELDAWRQTCP